MKSIHTAKSPLPYLGGAKALPTSTKDFESGSWPTSERRLASLFGPCNSQGLRIHNEQRGPAYKQDKIVMGMIERGGPFRG
jgi:hypothetical protein